MGTMARQGSFCNLTLNEVQSHLGEPLHSMNLDDLITRVFPAVDGNPYLSTESDGTGSKKTVDEVWRDIQQRTRHGQLRGPSLGEMTLEDFLESAGVVMECAGRRNDAPQAFAQTPHWLQQYQQPAPQGLMEVYVPCRPVPKPLGVGSSMVLDAVFRDGQVAMSDPATPGRKRGSREGIGEKIVESRQKRMIKNRESAARSRARKQAYTNELENKVSRLEEENERLRKQKELDAVLPSAPPPEPKYQLRRSSSSPF